ncbi:MAG: hypothetical protein Q3988_05735 [Gemella sp.]|nr:hypothetical protein [Gemella sp.]
MKNFKKYFLISLLLSCVFIISACAKSSDSDKKQERKLTTPEILNKTINNINNLNSYETFTAGNGYSVLKDSPSTNATDYTIETSLIKEPLAYKLIDKSPALTSEYYYLAGAEYIRKSTPEISPDWESKADTTKTASYFQDTFHFRSIINYNKDFSLTESDNTYIVEFRPQNLDEFKNTYYSSASPSVKDKSKLEIYSSKVSIDKNTFLPISEEIEYKKIEYSDDSEIYSNIHRKEKREYKNFNSVETFKLPIEKENVKAD